MCKHPIVGRSPRSKYCKTCLPIHKRQYARRASAERRKLGQLGPGRDVVKVDLAKHVPDPLPSCKQPPHHWILGQMQEGRTPGRCKRCRVEYIFADKMVPGLKEKSAVEAEEFELELGQIGDALDHV